MPENVVRSQEGRRQQAMLQPPGAHQGQTQPGTASRSIEQGGVTMSVADYDDLKARMDRMQEEIQILRLERDQARNFVQPRVTSRTGDQGATAAQAASSSAQSPDEVDAAQIPVPSDGPILVDDQDEANGVFLLQKKAKVLQGRRNRHKLHQHRGVRRRGIQEGFSRMPIHKKVNNSRGHQLRK